MNPKRKALNDVSAAPALLQRLGGAARRLHMALMPDYNLKATVYWWAVVGAGCTLLSYCIYFVAQQPPVAWAHLALCASLAMVAGLLPVQVPHSKNSFTAGEIFIFLLLLMHGPEAAALASAGEAFLGSWRTTKRWTSRIASPCMAALALFLAGFFLQLGFGVAAKAGLRSDAVILLGSIVFAVCYFVANTLLVTMLPRLKRDEPLNITLLWESFGWLSLAYAANASVAAFLFLNIGRSGVAVVIAAVPVIGLFLVTGHYFFRREESTQAVRLANEAKYELAAKHVEELKVSEDRFHSAFTHASIGMALVNHDGDIKQSNLAFRELLGLPEETESGVRLTSFVVPEFGEMVDQELARIRAEGSERRTLEVGLLHADGRNVWVELSCSFFSASGSGEQSFILQVKDITARRQAEADLHHIAFHDALTGLPNRHRFNEHLSRAIKAAQRAPADSFGVLFLDFDRFKIINDSLGHTAGDQFLVEVSRRIEKTLRPSDVVARLGGDEFAILAKTNAAEYEILRLADRLLEVLCAPVELAGLEITSSASIGITLGSQGYCSPEEVLRDADTAMYKAKGEGKARYALFDASLHAEVANRLQLEGDLRRALVEGALTLQYQPLFDLKAGRLVGFEALARWNHPTLGPISPASFIPVAEESGSVIQLTDFVLRQACEQLRQWQQRAPAFADLCMHVNVAGNDIAKSNFVQRVTAAVLGAKLRPNHLTIELTENILMRQLEAALHKLNQLHDFGVGLSVDDFGTGYSSLSHLSALPIDSLKIDRSFVSNLLPGSKESAVIRAVVLLGHSLGKTVVAEGIETIEQLNQLRAIECDVGQGYYLSRPLAEMAVAPFLDELLPCPDQSAFAMQPEPAIDPT